MDKKTLASVTFMKEFLKIRDKSARLVPLNLNRAQNEIFDNWHNRLLIIKSRQLGSSTGILGDFFTEALFIPGLVVAVISHEEFATKRLLDKIDIFYNHLPADIKPKLYHSSDHEKLLENGSVIYIGTAGARTFGRGDTIHRALVSEEAHYTNPEAIIGGLSEAVPKDGYLIRETTPYGDVGYYYEQVQACITGQSNYHLIPLWWWLGEDYTMARGDVSTIEQDRGELVYTREETDLALAKGLTEDQIRWRRWKIRDMRSEEKGNLFPQEYISDLETCFLGPKDRVFATVDDELERMSLTSSPPMRVEDVIEIWREPIPGEKYLMWIDPCGGEVIGDNDPHDGVIFRSHPGGLEHVASIYSKLPHKPFAEKVTKWATYYNKAHLVIERNGVGIGLLNYILDIFNYPNVYQELNAKGQLSGRWGFFTTSDRKGKMISDTIDALRNIQVVTYDRKLIRQLRSLIYDRGKVVPKAPARDDRAMSFMGAISINTISPAFISQKITVGTYATC